jgi:hypothetical protein
VLFSTFFAFFDRFLPVFVPFFALFPSMSCTYLYVNNFFSASLACRLLNGGLTAKDAKGGLGEPGFVFNYAVAGDKRRKAKPPKGRRGGLGNDSIADCGFRSPRRPGIADLKADPGPNPNGAGGAGGAGRENSETGPKGSCNETGRTRPLDHALRRAQGREHDRTARAALSRVKGRKPEGGRRTARRLLFFPRSAFRVPPAAGGQALGAACR